MEESFRSVRIENKLDDIKDDINEIKITLSENTISLVEHMRRTKQLEERVEPIERRHIELMGSIKVFGWFIASISFLAGLAEILGFIYHVK